ncbi:MAG: DUF6206 family protein [Thermodesulfobacteriota bacterium]
MRVNQELLFRFETGLDPRRLERSPVPADLLGYGEISAIFEIKALPGLACKRMPLFRDRRAAQDYEALYQEYCRLLGEAGLKLPASATAIIEVPDRPVVLYIIQTKMPAERVGNRFIQNVSEAETGRLIERVLVENAKVWKYNEDRKPGLELAVDGQISNWVAAEEEPEGLYYLDTSTPFIKKNGRHQLDPELLLQAAPAFLRWLLRWLFVDEVMNRYYDPRKNLIDLAANLFKEQRPDLVPVAIEAVNRVLPGRLAPLSRKEVEKYYREDKLIWTLFLFMRRLDRRLTTGILRRRYEFILPGRIKR